MPNKDLITPVRRRFYLTFTAIGVILIAIGAVWAVGQIWTPMSIILFSAFLVFILRTPVALLEGRGVPRALGAAIMYVVAIMVIAAIALIFIPVVTEQFVSFAGMIPRYIQNASNYFSETFSQISEYLAETGVQDIVATVGGELGRWATSFASTSANAMFNTASTIGTVFLVAGVSIVVGFWVLKDLPKFSKEVYKLVGPTHSEDVRVIAGAFSRSLGGYLRGMIVSCLCTGTMSFIAYSIIGIPYPAIMALFTGLMVFIPFIGPAIAWILAGLVGLLISPLTGILTAVFTIAAQLIKDNVISPRVMGGNVELHPGVILVVIFIGAALGGVFGMLCAIPLTSAAKSIFIYYFEKRTGRQLVAEDGALFKGNPAPPHAPTDNEAEPIPNGRLQIGFRRKEGKGNADSGADAPDAARAEFSEAGAGGAQLEVDSNDNHQSDRGNEQ